MITCQQCNAPNYDGAIFCDSCGRELAIAHRQTSPTAPPERSVPRASIAPTAPPAANPYASFTHTPQAAPPQLSPVIQLRLPNGQRFTLAGKNEYTVGRDEPEPGALDVDLARWDAFRAGVSRLHFKIHTRPDGVFVEDLESKNMTVHNGYRLLPQQWYPLHDGDVLMLGGITLHVSFERP